MPDYPLILRDPISGTEESMDVHRNKAPRRGSLFAVPGVGIVRSRGGMIVGGDLVLLAEKLPEQRHDPATEEARADE